MQVVPDVQQDSPRSETETLPAPSKASSFFVNMSKMNSEGSTAFNQAEELRPSDISHPSSFRAWEPILGLGSPLRSSFGSSAEGGGAGGLPPQVAYLVALLAFAGADAIRYQANHGDVCVAILVVALYSLTVVCIVAAAGVLPRISSRGLDVYQRAQVVAFLMVCIVQTGALLVSEIWRASTTTHLSARFACANVILFFLLAAAFPVGPRVLYLATFIDLSTLCIAGVLTGAPGDILFEGIVLFVAVVLKGNVMKLRASADGPGEFERKLQSQLVDALRPILETKEPTQSSQLGNPLVNTRHAQLVGILSQTRLSVRCSKVATAIREVLIFVVDFLLEEVRHTSRFHVPLVMSGALTNSSDMTKDYIQTLLGQDGQAQSDLSTALESGEKIIESCVRDFSNPAEDDSCESLSEGADEWAPTIQTVSLVEGARPITYDSVLEAMLAPLRIKSDASLSSQASACGSFNLLRIPLASTNMSEIQKEVGSWSFDVFKVARLCNERPLAAFGQFALEPEATRSGLDPARMRIFLETLATHYNAQPYHNAMHATDVANSVLYFFNLCKTPFVDIDGLERCAGLVAAVAHDVGHDGRANRYHVAAESPLALLFSDQSPLESMHCAITFGELLSSGLLETLSRGAKTTFRNTVLTAILSTDLAKHVQKLNLFREDFMIAGSPQVPSPVRRREMLAFSLKCADIAHSSKRFDLHVQWTLRITDEFFAQGDAEQSAGLPCSPFCDRRATNIAESQRGFFDFIVSPLLNTMNEFLNNRRLRTEVLHYMESNRGFWVGYDGSDFDYGDPLANADTMRSNFCVESVTRSQLKLGSFGPAQAARIRKDDAFAAPAISRSFGGMTARSMSARSIFVS